MKFRLTDNEKLTLIVLLRCGPCSTYDMAYQLRTGARDVCRERGYNIALDLLNALKACGAATHGYSRWEITERGRIAAALLMFKEPKLQQVAA